MVGSVYDTRIRLPSLNIRGKEFSQTVLPWSITSQKYPGLHRTQALPGWDNWAQRSQGSEQDLML